MIEMIANYNLAKKRLIERAQKAERERAEAKGKLLLAKAGAATLRRELKLLITMELVGARKRIIEDMLASENVGQPLLDSYFKLAELANRYRDEVRNLEQANEVAQELISELKGNLSDAEKRAEVWHRCVEVAGTILGVDGNGTPAEFLALLRAHDDRQRDRIVSLQRELNATLDVVEVTQRVTKKAEAIGSKLESTRNLQQALDRYEKREDKNTCEGCHHPTECHLHNGACSLCDCPLYNP